MVKRVTLTQIRQEAKRVYGPNAEVSIYCGHSIHIFSKDVNVDMEFTSRNFSKCKRIALWALSRLPDYCKLEQPPA